MKSLEKYFNENLWNFFHLNLFFYSNCFYQEFINKWKWIFWKNSYLKYFNAPGHCTHFAQTHSSGHHLQPACNWILFKLIQGIWAYEGIWAVYRLEWSYCMIKILQSKYKGQFFMLQNKLVHRLYIFDAWSLNITPCIIYHSLLKPNAASFYKLWDNKVYYLQLSSGISFVLEKVFN